MAILDSGARRNFETGAVRDIADGKGRCDLLPLHVISRMYDDKQGRIFRCIERYIREGDISCLYEALWLFADIAFDGNQQTALLEVSKQYEEGAKKYTERNWEKGIPVHCFIDSAVRHYLKVLRGDQDEPHSRAVIWNLLGAIWTHENHPELIDLPFIERDDGCL